MNIQTIMSGLNVINDYIEHNIEILLVMMEMPHHHVHFPIIIMEF